VLTFDDSSFIYCEISSDSFLIPGNEPVDASFTGNWTVTIHRPGDAPLVWSDGRVASLPAAPYPMQSAEKDNRYELGHTDTATNGAA
jgi:hypothetical protein